MDGTSGSHSPPNLKQDVMQQLYLLDAFKVRTVHTDKWHLPNIISRTTFV